MRPITGLLAIFDSFLIFGGIWTAFVFVTHRVSNPHSGALLLCLPLIFWKIYGPSTSACDEVNWCQLP
jgi:hypothetical protein